VVKLQANARAAINKYLETQLINNLFSRNGSPMECKNKKRFTPRHKNSNNDMIIQQIFLQKNLPAVKIS